MKTTNLDPEHQLDVTRGRKSTLRSGSSGITVRDGSTTGTQIWDVTVIGGTWTVDDDGTAVLTIDNGGVTVVGTVTPDGTPFAVSAGTSYRAFPGVAWLDDPTGTVHGVGDRFLISYRDATDHLVGGKIVGKIATVTDTIPWTYTLGSQFDIEDVANDLRPQGDHVSVLDIGDGTYHAVLWVDEYNEAGAVNLLPHFLICDAASSTMTSGSTWTRRNVAGALSGHTQDAANGRLHRLPNGTYMAAAQVYVGGTQTPVVISSSDITNWSAPTLTNIVASGYNECDFEEMPDGTLIAHLRNTAGTNHYSSTSTDSGATWSAPAQLFAAVDYPAWRRLNSGIGLTVYQSTDASSDTAWRQTQSAVTDTGWGSETILDSTGNNGEYATILQLDNNHALIVYGVQTSSTDSDIYSQVFTDSSIIGSDAISGITVQDEGVALSNLATTLDFVGPGVTASGSGATKTVTIDAAAAGHYEVLMTGASPAEALEDGSGTDWLYTWVT